MQVGVHNRCSVRSRVSDRGGCCLLYLCKREAVLFFVILGAVYSDRRCLCMYAQQTGRKSSRPHTVPFCFFSFKALSSRKNTLLLSTGVQPVPASCCVVVDDTHSSGVIAHNTKMFWNAHTCCCCLSSPRPVAWQTLNHREAAAAVAVPPSVRSKRLCFQFLFVPSFVSS